MKKAILGLFLVLGAASFADSRIELKGAYDLGGKYHTDYGNVDSKASSGEVGVEYRADVLTPGLEFGAGVAYQFHDKIKDSDAEGYNSVPIYATLKYNFATPSILKPYIKGDLGYSINTKDYKDGLYYGVGAGVNVNNFNIEVMYKENKGKYETRSNDYKADYRRVTLGLGYDFALGY